MTSIEKQLKVVVVAKPIKVVKDPIILNRLREAFEEQLRDVKTRAAQHLQQGVVSTVPILETNASENDNFEQTAGKDLNEGVEHMQAQRKKGRKTTTKLLQEVPFSFETPTFCVEENIDVDLVLLNRFREVGSWGNHVPKFSVAERLQNWLLVKRERSHYKKQLKHGVPTQDCYYHHLPSQKILRSMPEVIYFLLYGDFPPKGCSKKANMAEANPTDNQDSSSTSQESTRRAEMPFTFPIVNKKKRSYEKLTNELDDKEISYELNNKMEKLESEIMFWDEQIGLYKMIDNEIQNELMIKELLNQPGDLLFTL